MGTRSITKKDGLTCALVLFVVLLTLGSQKANASSQEIATSALELGQSLDKRLESGGTHAFTVDMKKDQVAIVKFARGGIGTDAEVNLRFKVKNPNGSEIEQSDTANGASLLVVQSSDAGVYTIEVKGWTATTTGRYKTSLEKIAPLPVSPSARVDVLLSHFYSDDRPGAAVAIIEGGRTRYLRTFGLADIEKQTPFSLNTRTEMASLSKQFTAYGIAVLIERGDLSLSDTVDSIIPEFPQVGRKITVHHLIHHLSGLRDYEDSTGQEDAKTEGANRAQKALSHDRIWGAIVSTDDTYFEPGTEYRYSNTGYFVLAKIIERVTGSTYPNWMQENIFDPLEMHDTFVWTMQSRHLGEIAHSYKKPPNLADQIDTPASSYEVQSKSLESTGGAHVHSSISDMVKWSDNYRTGLLGGQPVLKLVGSGITDQPQPWDYLFGLKQFEHLGLVRRGHEGLTQGYRTQFAYFPERELAFIYVTNDAEWRTFYLAEKVIQLYLSSN